MKYKKYFLGIIGYTIPLVLLTFMHATDHKTNKYDLLGAFVIAFLFILITNFIANYTLYKIFDALLVILFNVFSFIEIAHHSIFNYTIKESTFFIVFDSNLNESKEFFSMYFDWYILLFLILLILGLIIQILGKNKKLFTHHKSIKLKLVLLVAALFLISSYKIRSHTLPHVFLTSYKKYILEKEKLNKIYVDKKGGNFSEVTRNKIYKEEELYVLIIGESTTRNKMSLYNYNRNTNPRLNRLRNKLIVYNDVISPHTHTIASLEKVLTFANHEFPDKKYDGTVLQLFNRAGFETFWISNQNPLGIDETLTTIFSKGANRSSFVSSSNYQGYSYDENIFKPLEKALELENEKKFIIIHLIGTHGAYSNRFPKEFTFFKDKPKTNYNTKNAYQTINDYDNAVLYNDYIVSEIIEKVKKRKNNSFVLYFSDHGDDVYETFDHSYHSENDGTKPMYDIPFIFWMSEKYRESFIDNLVFDENRKYSTENLIYTISDLANIKFKEFIPEKSIVNKQYQKEPRIILEDKEYDEYFNKK